MRAVSTICFGTRGAATAWLVLNIYYLGTLLPLVHRNVLHAAVGPWFTRSLGRPAIVAVGSFGLTKLFGAAASSEALTWGSLALALPAYAVFSWLLMSAELRNDLATFGPLAILRRTRRGIG